MGVFSCKEDGYREKGVYLPIVLYLCTSKNKVPKLFSKIFPSKESDKKPYEWYLLEAGKCKATF